MLAIVVPQRPLTQRTVRPDGVGRQGVQRLSIPPAEVHADGLVADVAGDVLERCSGPLGFADERIAKAQTRCQSPPRYQTAAMRFAGKRQVFHTYAIWDGWAFDHSGWNPEPQLLVVNTDFEGHPLECVKIMVSLAEFCKKYHHRMPKEYWDDPLPRARDYVSRHIPPWA